MEYHSASEIVENEPRMVQILAIVLSRHRWGCTDCFNVRMESKLDLKDLIDRQKIPGGLKEMVPNQRENIDYRFSSQWKWEEFKEKGCFHGNQFTNLHDAREPYDNFGELIGLVANMVASLKAVA